MSNGLGSGQKKRGRRRLRIALAGNPNAGKTTIFNALTGARHHVGNYPGVTVETKEGRFSHRDQAVSVVDLPGTYSLTAYSADELVARQYVINEKPDLVVDVIDASNLERNLYLAVQLMELRVPLILAFNMSDVVEARGHEIDVALLSRLLGVTIVRMVGNKGVGVHALKEAIVRCATGEEKTLPATVTYGREVEQEIRALVGLLDGVPSLCERLPARWLAVKLLEGDREVMRAVRAAGGNTRRLFDVAREAKQRLRAHFGDDAHTVLADQRYGFISGACQEAVKMTVERRHSMSDRIDEVLTSRLLGLPIFLLLMYLVFKLTFTVGEPLMHGVEILFKWLAAVTTQHWPEALGETGRSLVVDGIMAGVGGVLVFVPTIALLFLAIAALEDSGYMARAAFIMDGIMHRIGLHGKSFIPMLIGFGCTVPAILATRTLENRRDRLTTMLVLPLFSCGARLPIYTLFIAAFFGERWRTPMLMLVYLIGIVLGVLLARLLRATLFKGTSEPLVMELPPYRLPTLRGLAEHTWERAWMFVRKAGTVIVGISVVLWVLTSYPKLDPDRTAALSPSARAQAELSHSVAGRIGHALAPVMRHVGFDWKTSTALIGAFAAKEVFVAQLGIVNALGEADAASEPLRNVLRREYSPLQAFCIMIFCLISVPCMMTIVTTWKESGALRWAVLQLVGLTVLAYVLTLVIYQSGRLIAFAS